MIQKLPLIRFAVGDNACVCSETLLTTFSGVEKDDPAKDEFNFYLSQMRTRIEQTFRLVTAKWRIKHVGKLFMCITRLHNFCINEGKVYLNSIEDTQGGNNVFMHSDASETRIAGSSVLRDIIVQDLV